MSNVLDHATSEVLKEGGSRKSKQWVCCAVFHDQEVRDKHNCVMIGWCVQSELAMSDENRDWPDSCNTAMHYHSKAVLCRLLVQ